MDVISLIVTAVCLLTASLVAWVAVHGYRLYGGLRLITCPETAQTARVKIHASRALASKLAGRSDLRLRSCSRWPERQGCDQACVAQIAAAPDGCRARALPRRAPESRSKGWVPDRFVGTTKNRLR